MQYTERYARQIMLPEIGLSGQQALARASVLIVGAGGLGSPISLYLCTAGIGRIGLIDGDTVSESNLQRQILYTENETGRNKVECAKQTLSSRNESCRIDIYPHFLTEENAREIIEPYDIIVDGCDNYATRYLIDDWCSRLQKPYVYGSIEGFKGQVSIFNGKKGKRYVDLDTHSPAQSFGRCHRAYSGRHRQYRSSRGHQTHYRVRNTPLQQAFYHRPAHPRKFHTRYLIW